MSAKTDLSVDSGGLFVSSEDFFSEMVSEAFLKVKINRDPFVERYIVDLLVFFVDVRNLFDGTDDRGRLKNPTLAEMMLRAANTDSSSGRTELLKRLGDISLYMSGFFAKSIERKTIDLAYYRDMGGIAYSHLGETVRDPKLSSLYIDLASHFQAYVDALAFISEKTSIQSDENLLRLYDRYLKTGSLLVKERLISLGLDLTALDFKNSSKQ